jgi:EAL domain-containing protein (putative c-di-GMP-specific phosphodiesterase class I)
MDASPPPDLVAALRALLDSGGTPALVFQPIVDVVRAEVVGYETLSRFPGPPQATPDRWFDAAAAIGAGDELEARVIQAALRWRPALPPNTFLTINVRPGALPSAPVRAALASAGGLGRIVLELTEQDPLDDHAALLPVLEAVREAGGMVAIDDAGAGYAGLRALLALRPQIIKLDRGLISGIDLDPAKRALVSMLGRFADEVDAWILAEGIEEVGELEELHRLGVPLAQGYLLGRPEPRLSTRLPEGPVEALRDLDAQLQEAGRVGVLVERLVPVAGAPADGGVGVAVDRWIRPTAVHGPGMPETGVAPLRVRASDGIAQVARRAMARPPAERFTPVVCCDERGRYVGIVRVERLVDVLSAGTPLR